MEHILKVSAADKSTLKPARRIQFAFTDEQEQFRSALRRFLNDKSPTTEVRRLMATAEGYDPAVWRQLSEELSLPGIQIPEQYGGAGFGMVELCIVTEELGRALLCAPYFSTTVLATNAILNAGTEAQKSSLLPDLASGARLATLAITELNGNWDPLSIEAVATTGLRRLRLDGVKSYVVDGHVADLMVVAARASQDCRSRGPGAIHSERRFSRRRATPSGIDGSDSQAGAHRFSRARMRTCSAASMTAQRRSLRTLDQAAVALANEMMGGAQALLDSAVNYSKLRVQFGRTIGSFQAIKHKLRRHAARGRARQVSRLLRGSSRGIG